MKKLDNDTVWTWVITLLMIAFFMIMSMHEAKAQVIKRDTLLYNQFSDYVNWSKQLAKEKKTESHDHDEDRQPEIYIDRIVIDRRNKKILLYSNYHILWKAEFGAILILDIESHHKRK